MRNYCTSPHLHHGLPTSTTLWQHLRSHQRYLGYTRKDCKMMPNTTYGMIPTYGDSVTTKCIPDTEINSILQFCHTSPRGDQYRSIQTARKVLDCKFYWTTIFRDAYHFVSTYEKYQKVGMVINKRHEMPQQPILFCDGIDFMGPFPVSNGYSYILLAVDYVSRWVEAIATKTNDAKVVVDFLKSNIFSRFGVLKALISDQGSHFYNKATSSLLHKYGVVHRIATVYYPQTNGQPEVFNREIKKMLQKMTNPNKKDWSKLRSRWDGAFVITNVFPYGVVELKDEHTNNTFKVNGHQIKLFHEGSAPLAGDMETISLMEETPPDDAP
ncbi:Gag-Pol polyprotein, partial [Mucuna pruriens]